MNILIHRSLSDFQTTRKSNQSILKEINPVYSLEGLMLKLKLQYFGHFGKEPTHWKRPGCWERLRAWGEGADRGWDGWMASLTQWTWVWTNSGTVDPGVVQSMGITKSQTWLSNWMTNIYRRGYIFRIIKCIFGRLGKVTTFFICHC